MQKDDTTIIRVQIKHQKYCFFFAGLRKRQTSRRKTEEIRRRRRKPKWNFEGHLARLTAIKSKIKK